MYINHLNEKNNNYKNNSNNYDLNNYYNNKIIIQDKNIIEIKGFNG